MNSIVLCSFSGVVGVVVGAVGHSFIAKKTAASVAELTAWAKELRSLAIAEADVAKAKVESLIQKIESKL
jgi:hypothetical protein